MFSCLECRKCFIFAKTVHREESLEELVRRDVATWFKGRKVAKTVLEETVAERIKWFEWALAGVEIEREWVIIDGHLHDTAGTGPWEFEGWYARHRLKRLPQVEARRRPKALGVLEDGKYWTARARD